MAIGKIIIHPVTFGGGTTGTGSTTGTGGTTTPATPVVLLTWFQAEAWARGGGRIARLGWVDRYLEFTGALWWLQKFDAVTKVLTTRAVVQASDFAIAEFRAIDWTAASGQIIPADQLAELLKITTVFP